MGSPRGPQWVRPVRQGGNPTWYVLEATIKVPLDLCGGDVVSRFMSAHKSNFS